MPDYGSRVGQTIGSTASGASAGFAIGGPVGGVIGGTIGLITGLTSKSPAEERKERIADYRKRLKQLRFDEQVSATKAIGQERAALQNRLTGGGARRALAAGRSGDVEAYIAPGVGEVANVATGQLAKAQYEIDQRYNQAELGLEQGIFEAPIQPNTADYFNSAAGAVGDIAGSIADRKNMDILLGEEKKDREFYRGLYQQQFNRGQGSSSLGDMPPIPINPEQRKISSGGTLDTVTNYMGADTPYRVPRYSQTRVRLGGR